MRSQIPRKKRLEKLLNSIPAHPSPKVELEQYSTPSTLVATILWIAEFHYHDISGRRVVDLGCGTGRLGLGAALLGAEYVVMLDIDEESLRVAKIYSQELNLDREVDFVVCTVEELPIREGKVFHTALQNPPFGVHRRGIDIVFVKAAHRVAEVIYTIHKTSTEEYVKRIIEELGRKTSVLFREKFCIPYMFNFHRKRKHCFLVSVLRVS
uniref:Methyltransferase domain-containing protein n=1 Tax=Thermofilum pendens TaxID=2269 RepID=A0A7C4FEF3_THEPE